MMIHAVVVTIYKSALDVYRNIDAIRSLSIRRL